MTQHLKTQADYRKLLVALLPRGLLWSRMTLQHHFIQLLNAIADGLFRVHVRALALMDEALPATTDELLPEWERVFGLPDPCVGQLINRQQRKAALLEKLMGARTLSKAFYLELANTLGYDITITEFRPFRAGINRAGEPVNDLSAIFTWQINGSALNVVFFRAGLSAAGDPLQRTDNESLQCAFLRLKPAHTQVIFNFT